MILSIGAVTTKSCINLCKLDLNIYVGCSISIKLLSIISRTSSPGMQLSCSSIVLKTISLNFVTLLAHRKLLTNEWVHFPINKIEWYTRLIQDKTELRLSQAFDKSCHS